MKALDNAIDDLRTEIAFETDATILKLKNTMLETLEACQKEIDDNHQSHYWFTSDELDEKLEDLREEKQAEINLLAAENGTLYNLLRELEDLKGVKP